LENLFLNSGAESGLWIIFRFISATAEVTPQVTPQVTLGERLLQVLEEGELNRKDILEKLQMKDIKHFRQYYLLPALVAGLIEMTIPDKPNSRLQKYRLTAKGKAQLP
jgi:ATP-dependent DNA helicase RecG